MPTAALRSLRKSLAWCAFFLGVDVILLGAPMLGTYAAIALLVWLGPRTLLAWRNPLLRKHRALVVLVTLCSIALDVGAYLAYEHTAQARVTKVAEALARYRAIKGTYPERLQQLTPEHLAAVPAAKPGFVMMGSIHYLRDAADPALMYFSFPPYGRKLYNVATREWTETD